MVELSEKQISVTPCGILFGKTKIVGRYWKVNGVTAYQCLICGEQEMYSGEELINHVKSNHPDD